MTYKTRTVTFRPFQTYRNHRGLFFVLVAEFSFHLIAAYDQIFLTARHYTQPGFVLLRELSSGFGGLAGIGVIHAVIATMLLYGIIVEDQKLPVIRTALAMSIGVWAWYFATFTYGAIYKNGVLVVAGASLMGGFMSFAAFREPAVNPATSHEEILATLHRHQAAAEARPDDAGS